MPDEPGGGVFISTEKIYDQLVTLNDNVRDLVSAMEAVKTELTDKESRLRSVEKWKHVIPVAYLGTLVAIATAFANITGKP